MDYVTMTNRPFVALKRFLYFLLWVIELLLLAEFFIQLAGFNPEAPFTRFMKAMAAPFIWPFQNIYPPIAHGWAVIDWSILIAMVVYQLALYVLISLLELFWPRD